MSDIYIPSEIDYLSKDYASFRKMIEDQLALWAPNWTEDHPADLGNAIVELLAYVADYVSYYQDAVATEAYLGTARRRTSVERHVRLLDYWMHQGCNAWVWVHVPVQDRGRDPVTLPAGAKLLTRVDDASIPAVIPAGSAGITHAVAQGALIFETMHSADLFGPHNQISFYAGVDPHRLDKVYDYSDPPRVWLRQGACSAVLRDPVSAPTGERTLRLQAGDVLIFEESRHPYTGRLADPKRRHPVRLTRVIPSMDSGSSTVEIGWADEDALPFRLCVAVRRQMPMASSKPDGMDPIEISVARGNIVLASHGETIPGEELTPVDSTRRYFPRLLRRGLTFQIPYDHGRALNKPAAYLRAGQASQALPAIHLVELGLEPVQPTLDETPLLPLRKSGGARHYIKDWIVQSELLSSGIFARDCVAEIQENRDAYLRFGFGETGWKPEVLGARFIATYRIGKGTIGNIGRDAIGHLAMPAGSDASAFLAPRNPLPAWGGVDPSSIEEARLNAPVALRTQLRCVVDADYVEIAKRHPEVLNAAVQTSPTGPWPVTFIYVQRRKGRPTDGEFIEEVYRYLDPFRIAGRDIEVREPCWAPLQVRVDAYVPPALEQAVRRTLENELGHAEFEPGNFGLFYPDRWTFGQKLYQSQVIARTQVTGVARVEVKFSRAGEELRIDPIPVSPVEILKCSVKIVLNGREIPA